MEVKFQFRKFSVQVRRGVEERQYVPNWVPSKGNVEALLNMQVTSGDAVNIFTTMKCNMQIKNLLIKNY